MNPMTELFGLMDTWRHFPNYQLERRADIFFALYLPEVLEATFGFAINRVLAPEFPVRIGTIYPNLSTVEKSYKIDYLALSASGDKAIFVELKTEGQSRRPEQDKYLRASKAAGLQKLLGGLIEIFRATNSKQKYFRLFRHLEAMELLRIPESMNAIMDGPTHRGANEESHKIEIITHASESLIVYVQPNGAEVDEIPFKAFADVVRRHDDPVSQRFAASLCEWADLPAGKNSTSR